MNLLHQFNRFYGDDKYNTKYIVGIQAIRLNLDYIILIWFFDLKTLFPVYNLEQNIAAINEDPVSVLINYIRHDQ